MRQANGSPLPDGVKFFIWPRYVLSVDGVEVRLSRLRARILLFLMSRPGMRFSVREIARAIYWDREDGGACSANTVIPTQVFSLRRACLEAGIDLYLKAPGAMHGYAFMGVGLIKRGNCEDTAEKALRVSRRIAQDESASNPPRKRPIRRPPGTVIDTSKWSFPERVERRHHRQSERNGS